MEERADTRGRVSFEDRDMARRLSVLPYEEEANDYFSAEGGSMRDDTSPTRAHGLSIRIPPSQPKTELAFAALQYLPMPVLVLSSAHTVVLANEAMGRLFGIDIAAAEEDAEDDGDELSKQDTHEVRSATDILYGTTLAQLGVDLLQNGSAVFVSWDEFMGTIVDDASKAQRSSTQLNTYHPRNDRGATPKAGRRSTSRSSSRLSHTSGVSMEVHDAIVSNPVYRHHHDL